MRLSRTLVVVAFASVASAYCPAAVRQEAWQKFVPPTGNFSISMPGVPQEKTQLMDQPLGGKIHLTMYLVVARPTVYIVSDSEIDKDSPALSEPESVLTGVESGYASSTNSKLVSSTKTKIQGFPAHRMLLKGPTMITEGITLIAANHNYTVVIASSGGTLDEAIVNKFLKSFKVLKQN